MPASTLATRLPPPLLDEVRRFAKRRRLGPSEALRTIVAEWVAMARFPTIEFRDGPAGRRPGLRAGPDVWEVAMVARGVGASLQAVQEYLSPGLPEDAVRQALAFAEEHREEVDAWVEENERVGLELERAWQARRPAAAGDAPR